VIEPLPTESLRWFCDERELPFQTTAEVEPLPGVVGQQSAVEALRFGVACDAPGQNVFVRGLTGSRRMALVGQLLTEMRPSCPLKEDRCYVQNFARPDCPRLITLAAGTARRFRRAVHTFAEFVRDGLNEALDADAIKSRRRALEERIQAEAKAITRPFELDLQEAGLQLVTVQAGQATQTVIFPTHEGKAIPPEEFEALHAQGEISEERHQSWHSSLQRFQKRLEELGGEIRRLQRQGIEEVRGFVERTAREILLEVAESVLDPFRGSDVKAFIDEVLEDVLENRLGAMPTSLPDPLEVYGVNVVVEHHDGDDCAVVVETTPTLTSLLGSIERRWGAQGPVPSDFRSVRGGSILRADGGFLVLDARDLLNEPGAWRVLVRTLRTGQLELVPPELGKPMFGHSIKPEPIPVRLRVILVGDASTYHVLDSHDPDFGHLFKVLSDFDAEIEREPDGVRQYAGVLARLAMEERLSPFAASGVAALVEHGARVASRGSKLTARFGRVADIAREAAFLAREEECESIERAHVQDAILRTRARADLPSRRFQALLKDGTIHVRSEGACVGQINGLAVLQAGPITYGFPARITASIGPGNAGVINIEGHASLSGSIHTKGFQILRGLLRHLLRTEHPLAFSASLAFEQSYGGIDGDSASGAETCCLISALTDVPIAQSMAMTGAIDQHGRIQAIGGVNEKIEGFFDTCRHAGLNGEQGVLIPRSNADDLMLRSDVVEACQEGRFRIWAVESIHEALELLTGVPAGERDAEGVYPEGSLLRLAVDRAREFWLKTLRSPRAFADVEDEDEDEDESGHATELSRQEASGAD